MSIFDGKYGKAQIFDVQRSPVYPQANQEFRVSGFANIFNAVAGGQVDWGTNGDRYVKFVDTKTQDSGAYANAYEVSLVLYEADGTVVTTLANYGTLWGIDGTGFFYEGQDHYGYFISNAAGYEYGSAVTYTPTSGLVTDSSVLTSYAATTSVLAAGQTAPSGNDDADTTGPTPASPPTIDVGDDGAVEFNGTVDAGNTVTLVEANGDTVLATAEVDGSGNWTISPDFADGSYEVKVRVTDPSGNSSDSESTLVLTVSGGAMTTAVLTESTTTIDGDTTEEITVTPATAADQAATGGQGTAEVALYYGNNARSLPVTVAELPETVGLVSTGARTPADDADALDTLIQLINYTAGDDEAQRNNMVDGGEDFLTALNALLERGPLIVNSVKFTVADGVSAAPGKPIVITGSPDVVSGTDGAPVEAIVIDASALPAGTKLQLDNVEFAVVVGDGVELTGGSGRNIVYAGSGSQKMVLGAEDDELHGGEGNDTVGSEAGDDQLYGDDGDDTVFGGAGNDTLWGGAGDDNLDGNDGLNTVSYSDASAGVQVSLRKSALQDTVGAGRDLLKNFQNLTGSDFDDVLRGDGKANVLVGGDGDDQLNGGKGKDTASYATASAAVTVSLSVKVAQDTDGAGSDLLKSIENLTGSAYDDTLTGNGGRNLLEGGEGADTLTGMGGKDTFVYRSLAECGDTITDFKRDKVAFAAQAFGDLATGKLNKANFVANAGGTAADGDDYFVFDTATGKLYFDADGDDTGEAVLVAELVGRSSLSASDIVIV